MWPLRVFCQRQATSKPNLAERYKRLLFAMNVTVINITNVSWLCRSLTTVAVTAVTVAATAMTIEAKPAALTTTVSTTIDICASSSSTNHVVAKDTTTLIVAQHEVK